LDGELADEELDATVAVRTLWPESIIANRYSFQDATKM
jgi:hypothetical protein